MNHEHVLDIWLGIKEYLDKKTIDAAASVYVDTLADFGVSETSFRKSTGTDEELDEAISNYLKAFDEYEDEDEDWDDEE